MDRKVSKAKRAVAQSPRAMARRAAYMYVFGNPEMQQLSAYKKALAKDIIRDIINADITTSLEVVRREVIKRLKDAPSPAKHGNMLSPQSTDKGVRPKRDRAQRSASSGVGDLIGRLQAVRLSPTVKQEVKKQKRSPSWEKGLIDGLRGVTIQAARQPIAPVRARTMAAPMDALTAQMQAMAIRPRAIVDPVPIDMLTQQLQAMTMGQPTRAVAIAKKPKNKRGKRAKPMVFGPTAPTRRQLDMYKARTDAAEKERADAERRATEAMRRREAKKEEKDVLASLGLFKLGGKRKHKRT